MRVRREKRDGKLSEDHYERKEMYGTRFRRVWKKKWEDNEVKLS